MAVHSVTLLDFCNSLGVVDWMHRDRGRHAIAGSFALRATEDEPSTSGVSDTSEFANFKF